MAAERRKCLSILGLYEGATEEEIKKAYKKLALQYHPDKNESDDAKGKFQEIGYAYKYLTDGPTAFGTNHHDFRDDFLQRLFEEFLAQSRSPFGGFTFFCDESDDDDYYVYGDSSDDCYCGSCHTKGHKGRQTYENRYPRPPPTPQYHPPPSKKQMRKKEKRQRQKERAKERKEQDRQQKRSTQNQYTSDINTESKESKKKSFAEENLSTKSEDKTDTGSSRPDTPVLNQQSQKPNKKQKKKIESEQRKREKEMEEIARELKEKQEREMEKQREKERIAAQKKEEEKENDINLSHFYDNGRKSRKARQREKRRQDNRDSSKQTEQRDNSDSSVSNGKTVHNWNTNRNSSGDGRAKEKTGANTYQSNVKKPGMHGNRFDILVNDDWIDSVSRPLSRSSVSSSDSQSQSKQSRPASEEIMSSGHTSQSTGFSKPTQSNGFKSQTNTSSFRSSGEYKDVSDKNKQFKTRTFQNTNRNQNNSNRYYDDFETNSDFGKSEDDGFVKGDSGVDWNENGKNTSDIGKGRRSPAVNRSLSDEMKCGFSESDDSSRQFVKDWSVYYSEEEDSIDNLDVGYGSPQYTDSQSRSQYSDYGGNNFENRYNSLYHPRADLYQPKEFTNRREFIPRTRGYHGSEFRPYFGGPPVFPPYIRPPPPFARGGMFPPPPPHFRGGYSQSHAMGGYSPPHFRGGHTQPHFRGGHSPPHSRGSHTPSHFKGGYQERRSPKSSNGGYPGPRNGPPMDMHRSGYEKQLDSSIPHGGSFQETKQNVRDYMKRNASKQGNETNHFKSTNTGSLDSLDDFVLNETDPDSTDNQNVRDARPESTPGRTSPYMGVDMGLDEFLSKDSLGVPSGMFNDTIKNYYK